MLMCVCEQEVYTDEICNLAAFVFDYKLTYPAKVPLRWNHTIIIIHNINFVFTLCRHHYLSFSSSGSVEIFTCYRVVGRFSADAAHHP